jgi:hypothetical protein
MRHGLQNPDENFFHKVHARQQSQKVTPPTWSKTLDFAVVF